MNYQLSGVDLSVILKELQLLKGAKVDKIFQSEKDEFIFRFHKTGIGKLMLRIFLPRLMYLTSYKKEMQDHPKGFCMYLRKYLTNARIKSFSQIAMERIVKIIFETKESDISVYIELFGKGNVILCDEKDIILSASVARKWADRTILPKERYIMPPMRLSIHDLDDTQMTEVFQISEKTYVKTLAIDFGLGGKYAQELCSRADVPPKDMPEKEGITKLITQINKFKEEPIVPSVVKDGEKVIDIVPFSLKAYENNKKEFFETFNEALDKILSKHQIIQSISNHTTRYDKKIAQAEHIIKTQEDQINKFEEQIVLNQEIGESIYNNYSFLSELLGEIQKATKNMSWEDIKKRVESHPRVKSFNTKTKKIRIDI
jgi:predicted ribosome quality control (RQC) complex YloA/Tae2 family protein